MNSTITYLPTTIKPLSLQAATWSYVTTPYALREDGCKLRSGEQNCSKSCKDVDTIFSSGATFENCLAYPLISSALGVTNASASEPAIEVYGVIPNDVDGSRAILSTISNCFLGYVRILPGCILDAELRCSGDTYSGCSQALLETNSTGIFPLDASNPIQSSSYECINSLCEYVASVSQPSADVGGIGVWISYVVQISICFIFWLGIEYFRFLHPLIVRCMRRKKQVIGKIHESRQEEMLVETVIDFHKCQCYFMSTILLAAIVATQTGGLGAFTLQDVFTNLVLLSVLSIGGSLPTMFILFKLRLMGHKSWFSFLLSTISLFLSIGLVWSSGPHKTISYDQLEQGLFSIPNCGTISPTALCLQGFSDVWKPGPGFTEGDTDSLYSTLYFRTYAAFGLSLVFWLVLLLDRFVQLDVETIEKKIFKRSSTPTEHTEREYGAITRRQWILLSWRFLDFLGCFGTIYIISLYLQSLVRFGIGSREWTFGQIVALTIWVPPIAQYCYLQLNGTEGNRWHLPKTLTVTRHNTVGRSTSYDGSEHDQQRSSTESNNLNATPRSNSRPTSDMSHTKVPAQRYSSRTSDCAGGVTDDDQGSGHNQPWIREKSSFSHLHDYNVGHG